MDKVNTSIIIIGGGIMQIPVIKQAKSMGLQVYVVDKDPFCGGMAYADIPIIADISDEEIVVREIKKAIPHQNITGVLTVGTDYSRTVSRVGELYDTPVLPYPYTKSLSDKSLMRTKLKNAGFPQPTFRTAENKKEFIANLNYFINKGIPAVVIKPVDSMGARGVKKIDFTELVVQNNSLNNFTDVIPDFYQTIKYSRKKKIIIEEVINGEEFSLDAIAFSGEIMVTGIADRIIEFPPFFIETGHVIPSQAQKEVKNQLVEGFIKAIRVMVDNQMVSGAFKGDLFFTDDCQVVVGEIAGRLSGGYMSGYTYPLSSGVNLMKAIIEISLGYSPFPLIEKNLGVVIEKTLVNKPGKIITIKNQEETKKCSGVHQLFIHVKEGDEIVAPENNLMKSANLIVRGKNYKQAEWHMYKAFKVLQIVSA